VSQLALRLCTLQPPLADQNPTSSGTSLWSITALVVLSITSLFSLQMEHLLAQLGLHNVSSNGACSQRQEDGGIGPASIAALAAAMDTLLVDGSVMSAATHQLLQLSAACKNPPEDISSLLMSAAMALKVCTSHAVRLPSCRDSCPLLASAVLVSSTI
jgi:hypothetical protein